MRIMIFTDAWAPQVNGVVRTLEHLREELLHHGHEVIMVTPEHFFSVPMPRYPEIRISLILAPCLKKIIQREMPDTIHIATEGPLGMAASRACRSLGYGFTTSYHTRFPEYLHARLPVPVDWSYAWLRRFHNAGSGCLVATKSIRDDLQRRGFRNLVEWTRGVDHERFNPNRRDDAWLQHLPHPFFLNVGRVSVEKNLDAFLDLRLPGTRIIVGDGPDIERLRAKYPDAVFTGSLFGEELAKAYASSDVFVFPSLTDTFGNVILESLASGTPVAAFPVAGPIDILSSTSGGICDHDLGRACHAALELSRAEARDLASRFSWRRCAEGFLRVQEGVLQTRPSTQREFA